LDGQLRTLTAEQAKFNATLRQPVNAEVLQRSLLLNTLIERKSISWTRIFADLERVLPFNVKLISVRLPQINSQNEVLLDVIVGAAQPQNIIGFLKKLEESPLFGAATVSQTQTPNQNEPLHRFRISVNYAQKL
jgi:type IV pilus assembly protein PilN